MRVDKQKFDTVLGRLINAAPQKRSERNPIRSEKPKRTPIERKA